MLTEEQLRGLKILLNMSLGKLLQMIRREARAEPSSEVSEDRIHDNTFEDTIEVSRVVEMETNEQQLSQKPLPRF
jgi:hypothetical protein